MTDIKTTLRQFIIDNFLFGDDDGLADDTSFLEEGIIDSTGMLELITFLEETFSIQLDDEELVPENLDSINNLINFLSKKQVIQQAQ
ncbi:MAG: acyl carrier protein [Desulfobacterales bacterium]|nr:acyl carrier protein [Desulfobacterales bacterium]